MANLTGTPTYVNVLRQLETTDPAHPNTWNPNYQALINNDAYLKGFIEGLMKAATGHTHSGVDGDGAKIPISSLKEDIVTQAELNTHIGSRGSAHAIVTTTEDGFMSKTDKSKLDGITAGANNYAHPTGDGNLHVPATGTTNSGKVLKAGTTAGSASWSALNKNDVGLANLDNTSDANKPISTATQKALDDKANKSDLTDHLADDLTHNRYGAATGTNTLVVTLSPIPKALVAGFTLRFKNTTANTGAASLNISGLGAKPIVKSGGTALSSGNLKAGGVYTVCYDGANFILQGEGGEYGTATASDVLNSKTIGTENGLVTGTIPSKVAQTYTPTTANQTIASGQYLSGTQTISGDADLIPSNIKQGINIFGVTGTIVEGKKWKKGLAQDVTGAGNISVTGLGFTPTTIIGKIDLSSSNESILTFVYTTQLTHYTSTRPSLFVQSNGYSVPVNFTITSDGFSVNIPNLITSNLVTWIAYQ